jgi:hypothetical protein
MDEKRIPISNAWLRQLMANGAVDPFKGPLKEFSQMLEKPFWCRQMENVLDHNMLKALNEVVPVVRQFKIGTSPYSEKKTVFGYNTRAWNTFPCTCEYRYAGVASSRHSVGQIGAKNPPLSAKD